MMLRYFQGRRFAPKWYFVIATLLFVALFVSLGCWQLRRADEKQTLQAQFNARSHAPPLTLAEITPERDIRYHPLMLTGHYDNLHTILLDNKIYQHRVGYEVVTPFVPKGSQTGVLVNRGWLPANTDRRVLPDIPEVTGEETITGIIYQMPGQAFTLGSITESPHWPLRIQAVDFTVLQGVLHRPLYPFVLWLSKDAPGGFVRDWQVVAGSAQKNIGYAVQWFTFAGVLVIIFLLLSCRGGSRVARCS